MGAVIEQNTKKYLIKTTTKDFSYLLAKFGFIYLLVKIGGNESLPITKPVNSSLKGR